MQVCKMLYFILSLLFIKACKNHPAETYKAYRAYKNYQPVSNNANHDEKNGPYKIKSLNGKYYMFSIPYEHMNLTLGDLCAGVTEVYDSETDSLLYEVDRYFGLDNTFLSNDGKTIAYINN